jgi:PAS domain S-box-containing protein
MPVEVWRADLVEPEGSIAALVLRRAPDRTSGEVPSLPLDGDASPSDAVVETTPDGVISGWNGGAKRLFGYCPEEAIGRPERMLVPPDLLDEVSALHERASLGEGIGEHQTARLTKDGRRVGVAVVVEPIRDATGAVVAVASVVRDTEAQTGDGRRCGRARRGSGRRSPTPRSGWR